MSHKNKKVLEVTLELGGQFWGDQILWGDIYNKGRGVGVRTNIYIGAPLGVGCAKPLGGGARPTNACIIM